MTNTNTGNLRENLRITFRLIRSRYFRPSR
jgi:hypothetical protein